MWSCNICPSVSGLFSLTWCVQGAFMCLHLSEIHSFLWLNNPHFCYPFLWGWSPVLSTFNSAALVVIHCIQLILLQCGDGTQGLLPARREPPGAPYHPQLLSHLFGRKQTNIRKKKCSDLICFSSSCCRLSSLSLDTPCTSFAFGSLISAVDPVATIAIFNALHVDPVLNMLVFGESILNDAVSIVLTNTAEGLTRKNTSDVSGWQTFLQALGYFLKMFFGSAALGTLTGLISALVLKHIDLRKTPSLEFGMMIIFAYLPYGLAEGISLSGIMAILFSGIVMSHYTHHNLSPVTQILMQQTLRTVAFLCETCVFAFLGLSIFSFPHKFEISFVIWCIVLVLFGRAVNIFPLSYLLNFFRDHKITPKMMFIMWFSGLRGAIPYALSLHLDLEPMEKRQLIGTTTIVIVLFTILLLGGSTMPLIRLMDIEDAKARRRSKKDVNLSKTEKMGNTIESEHLSELTEEEYEAHYIRRQDLKGFMWLDAKYLNPFFTRRLTQEDLHHGRIQMKSLTNKWYEEVRQGPSGSEDDEQELF
ncbi:sodium/hydrogen exchanger 8 isoform X3 [Ictidomys tridecemlineatus]